MTSLWAFRWSVSKGWYWRLERDCSKDMANRWLELFQKDEPEIKFKLSKNRPMIKKP